MRPDTFISSRLVFAALLAALSVCLSGCKGTPRQDTVIESATNPNHTFRAFVILRQYYVDGKFDTTPTTYVLVKSDTGTTKYENGEEFKNEEIVMQPSRCGPLSVKWTGDLALTVTCEKCGLALSAVGPHARGLGPIQIQYEGFPELSSWESAPRSN